MPVNPTDPLITGPWDLVAQATNPDMQYYHDTTRSDVQFAAVGNEVHTATMCIGPDGMPWAAHTEIEQLTTGGAAVFVRGVFVYRFDGTNWIQVPYTGAASPDGGLSPFIISTAVGHNTMLSQGWMSGAVVTGGNTNGVSQSPQICCDGTNIYVLALINFGGNTIHVYKWDGAAWSVLEINVSITAAADVALACSPADVGHPFIYYRTTSALGFVDRWDGASFVHIGGSNIPISAPETTIVTDNNFLRIDNAGNPHALNVRFFTTTSVPDGQNIWMHSWTGSAWVARPLSLSALGVSTDYGAGGTTQTGAASTSPIVSSYGTNGKFQVVFSLRRFVKTAGQEMLDQPAGFGAYVAEYDCDALAWIPLNGAGKYGHVYTYNADKAAGVKAIPLLAQNGPFALAEPEVAPSVNTCWLSEGGVNPIVMAFYGKWRVVSSWFPNLASQAYTNAFKVQLDSVATPPGTNSSSTSFIVRQGDHLYLPVRWWNSKLGDYQRWNNELDGDNGTGTHDDDAELPSLNPAVKNIFTIVSSYDAATNPNVGGTFWQQSSMFTNNQTKGLNTSFMARLKLEGSSGNGDVAIFRAGVFQGYIRISTYGVWQELVIVDNVFINSVGTQQLGLRLGINGGATSIKIDWLQQYPTNESDTTRMHTYLYRGLINQGFVPQIYRIVKTRP